MKTRKLKEFIIYVANMAEFRNEKIFDALPRKGWIQIIWLVDLCHVTYW